jgi:hypothetical protein
LYFDVILIVVVYGYWGVKVNNKIELYKLDDIIPDESILVGTRFLPFGLIPCGIVEEDGELEKQGLGGLNI